MSSIQLYIGDKKVDLSENIDILFNWELTDLNNPLLIKNQGYSKTVVLDGTNNNNAIFGHFWDLERYQNYGGTTGVNFNPSYRVPFTLYYNSSIYESGYVKLQRVITKNGVHQYEVGLFGGLGGFFYNLQTDWNTGEKKTLADLKYYANSASTQEVDLSFTINKETVNSAWNNVRSEGSKYGVINFAPTYAGLPDKNFDADKCLINFSGLSLTQSSGDCRTYNGYALGKLPDKLTMEEVKDYRSYLQTPVIRVKNVIEAICRKENNVGKYDDGYDVVLDPDFFCSTNPYYEKAWMTLNSLTFENNEGVARAIDLGDLPVINSYSNTETGFNLVYDANTSGETGSIKGTFKLRVSVPGATANYLHMTFAQRNLFSTLKHFDVIALQAYMSDSLTSEENVFTSSKIQWLSETNNITNEYYHYGDYGYELPFYNIELMGFDEYDGRFVKISNGVYEYEKEIEFTVNVPENARYLKLRAFAMWASSSGLNVNRNALCDTQDYPGPGYQYNIYDYSSSQLMPYNKDFIFSIYNNSSWGSNKEITKEKLLSTSFSPAEFLINYCKQFGLYIWKDVAEDKIYIQTRNNFFKKDDIKNLEDIIDTSKDVDINPTYVNTNFVSLTETAVEGESYKDYLDKYGKKFGQKIIDTGYEFNADTKELVSSPFKNAVQTREKSLYFFQKDDDLNPYVFNGFSYDLYKNGNYEDETITVEVPKKEISSSFLPLYEDKLYYDIMGKPQFEDSSHKGLSTEGVFLFFTGYLDITGKGYYLTDDNSYMAFLNNNPCWLMTNSEYDSDGYQIAKAITTIPRFSRYYEGNKWMVYSWDYGSPRELYIPDMVNNDDVNIYSLFFKNYYEDLYNINTKVVTCFVNANNLNVESLKGIYWFKNGLWRLNKIVDFNPATPETTKVEFIKIQDLDDLTNEDPTTVRWIKIYLDKYQIDQSGGTIVGTVITSDRYPWNVDSISIEPTSPAPRGPVYVVTPTGSTASSANFYLSVSENIRDDREVTIKVVSPDPEGGSNIASGTTAFSQEGVEYQFSISPDSISGGTLQYAKNVSITNPYYYDWSVTSKPEWITANPASIINGQTGTTGTTACTLTAAKNTTEVERTGVVVFTESTYGHTYNVSVLQAGYVFSISPDSLSFNKSGGTATVTITNPYGYSWIVESKPSWVSTGTSNGNLTVTADPNIVFERTGTLVIKDTEFNHTFNVSITQESGYVFDINPTYFHFLCDYELEDTLTITNPNSMAWTITNIPSWLTVSPTAGTGTSVSITAAENIGFERSGLSISVNETLCDQHYLFDAVQDSGYYFELLPATGLSFTSGNTSQTMKVACKAYNWQIISKPSWITASQTTGFGETNITLTAAENIGYARTGVVKVKNLDYNLEYTMDVAQDSGYVFEVSPLSFTFTSAGTGQQLTITNPNGYSWYIDGQPSWLHFSQTAGTASANVTVSADVNGFPERTDDFYVYEETISGSRKEIDVTQYEGYTLSYSPTAFTFNVTSGSSTITITNPDNYNLTISSNRNWISVNPTALTSSSSVTVSVTNNQSSTDDRTGVITITNNTRSKTHTLNLRQAGYQFRVEPTSAETLTFASGGETTFIMIYDGNNLNWEVVSYPSWLTPNVTTGNTTRSVNFTAPTNAGRPERTGVITVRDKAFNIDYTVNVKQLSGYQFSVSPTSFNFAGTGETKTFTITNPYGYSWQMVSPCGWLSFNPSTGNSNATVSVTAAANGWDARNCTFYVEETTYGGGAQMTASQPSGYTLSYSPTAFTFNAISGSSTLTITNPDNYNLTISSNANWLTVSPTATTSASQNVTVSAVNNSSSSDRSGVITITNNSRSKTHTINVSQAGYQFRVEPSSLTFASGGSTEFIMIYDGNNFNWEVTSYPSWLTPNVTTGNTTRSVEFTAATNAGRPQRTGTIKVKDKVFNIEYTVNVSQNSGYAFSVSPTSFNFNSAGTAQQFTITNTYGYSWQIVSSCGWLTFSQTAGTASATVTVTASPNGWGSRNCTFYVEETTYGGGAEMTASQASGYQFSYSPSEFEFNCKAGSSTLTINNPFGYSWSITNVPSWLTVSPSTGVSSASVTLTVQGNSSSNNRWQDIVLNELSMSHSYSINVEQYGNEFEVTPTSLSFASGGGSTYMYIYDADSLGWTISNKPNWITLSATAGTGTTTITVTAQRNTSGERSGSLTITEQTFGGTSSMPLTQSSGYQFSITPSSFTGLNRTGGTVTATVNNPNGYSWELYSVPSWITPSVSAGTASTSITFTYAANTYTDTRETESMGIAELTTGNYIELYFEQDGLLTPSINSITATVHNNPEPTGNTWTMQNMNNSYGLYGTWTSSPSATISGDLGPGETESQNTSVPITLTSFNGAVTGTNDPKTVTFTNQRSGQSETMTRQSAGGTYYYEWSGQMMVQYNDNITVNIS